MGNAPNMVYGSSGYGTTAPYSLPVATPTGNTNTNIYDQRTLDALMKNQYTSEGRMNALKAYQRTLMPNNPTGYVTNRPATGLWGNPTPSTADYYGSYINNMGQQKSVRQNKAPSVRNKALEQYMTGSIYAFLFFFLVGLFVK